MSTWYPAAAVAVCAVFVTAASASDRARMGGRSGACPARRCLPRAARCSTLTRPPTACPFPFAALVRKIEARAGCRPGRCAQAVLIPLGRSLQRTAAAPDFFAFPARRRRRHRRGRGSAARADRLYLGYQEKADLIEVISYNEAAGRFEFQLVRDYRAGGTPRGRVRQSRRLHRLPPESRADLLAPGVGRDQCEPADRGAPDGDRAQRSFHGIPVARGVDIPNAIDDATERANRIAVTQRIWREACDPAAARRCWSPRCSTGCPASAPSTPSRSRERW